MIHRGLLVVLVALLSVSFTTPTQNAAYLFPPGLGQSLGIATVVGEPTLENPTATIEFTTRRDITIMGPQAVKVEVRLPTGTIWREQVLPVKVVAGQHVRLTQRNP